MAQRQDFSVRSRVVDTDRCVGAAPVDLAVDDNDSTHRHLALLLGAAGLPERLAHVTIVVHGGYRIKVHRVQNHVAIYSAHVEKCAAK